MIDLLVLLFSLMLITFLSILLVCLIIVRKLKKQCERFVSGNLESLTDKEKRYRKKYLNTSDDYILNRVIRSECHIAGCIGFLTGLGGLVTLPITLPIDILTSIKSQRSLAAYVLSFRGDRNKSVDNAKILVIIFGTRKASQFGIKFTVSLALKYAPKVFLKAIPIIGGIVGYITGYLSTQTVAKYAKQVSWEQSASELLSH